MWVWARYDTGSLYEHASGCSGKSSSLVSTALALLLLFGHSSSEKHGSGSSGMALRVSTALALWESTALALQALYSFGPTPQSTAAFSQSPKSTNLECICSTLYTVLPVIFGRCNFHEILERALKFNFCGF